MESEREARLQVFCAVPSRVPYHGVKYQSNRDAPVTRVSIMADGRSGRPWHYPCISGLYSPPFTHFPNVTVPILYVPYSFDPHAAQLPYSALTFEHACLLLSLIQLLIQLTFFVTLPGTCRIIACQQMVALCTEKNVIQSSVVQDVHFSISCAPTHVVVL